MRIALHDFSGHPFQAELSRHLAARGHDVEHVSSSQYVSGKGDLERQDGDAPTLTFTGIDLDMEFDKYSPVARFRFEWAYGKEWVRRLRSQNVDAIVACNLPLLAMFLFTRYAVRNKVPYVMWHQDIYSSALSDELHRRLPKPLAKLGSWVFTRIEAYCTRKAAHVVAIGDAFTTVYPDWKVDLDRVTVIPNWAPLSKIFPVERTNEKSDELFDTDADSLRLVYAGTIGRKHNPDLLVELMRLLQAEGVAAQLAVVSQGEAAESIGEAGAKESLPIRLLPFQPADQLPQVLSSADVLVGLLEPDATMFSIPSKVLSYMAAGRPILGLMPADNPAAVDIVESGGFVADPDSAGVQASLPWLAELSKDSARISAIGTRTRATAERKFDVEKVASQFEQILSDASRR